MKYVILRYVFLLAAALTLLCSCSPKSIQSDILRVDFINVGQGDSTLISLPDGRFILCDTGPWSAKHILNDHLKSRKVKELAMLILTHPHSDHIGNADDIVKKYGIETLIMPDAASSHPSYGQFLAALSYTDTKITRPSAGDVYTFGEVTLTILSPDADDYICRDPNDVSIMLKLSYRDTDFIICSDNSAGAQADVLLSENELCSEVLKIAHHGSKENAVYAFIEAVDPDYAILSYGTGNSYGHPHSYTFGLLDIIDAEVFETAYGTVTVSTDGKNITVE